MRHRRDAQRWSEILSVNPYSPGASGNQLRVWWRNCTFFYNSAIVKNKNKYSFILEVWTKTIQTRIPNHKRA